MNRKWLLLLLLVITTACESPLRISIEETNPPTFKLSGSGELNYLIVSEVSPDDPTQRTAVLWKIVPTQRRAAWHLPSITYGSLPDGFRQETPADASPSSLKEGMTYAVGGPATGAEGGSIWFTIKNGKAVRVPKKDGTLDR